MYFMLAFYFVYLKLIYVNIKNIYNEHNLSLNSNTFRKVERELVILEQQSYLAGQEFEQVKNDR